jgi:hypothetical protein
MLWGVGISRSQWCDDIERIGAIFVIKQLVSSEYSTGVTSLVCVFLGPIQVEL